MGTLFVVVTLNLLFSGLVSSQVEEHGVQVKSILVEGVIIRGNRGFSEQAIRAYIETRRRMPYDPRQLDRDVRTLHASGHFEDVKCFVEDGDKGGKIVTFEVLEWPLIVSIAYEGLTDEIRSALQAELENLSVDIPNGSEYQPDKVNRCARAIKHFLETNGYPAAKVMPMIEKVSSREISLSFEIDLKREH